MQKSGQLFVFEGPDGVGKTTLAHALTEHLTENGIHAEYLSFPGRQEGTLGHHIYELHHSPEQFGFQSINPTSLQIMHIAAHIDAIEGHILPLLKAGTCVILDRYWWSTSVYGKTSGANTKVLETAIKTEILCWNKVTPFITFLITRSSTLRSEEDKSAWNKLCAAYYELAERQKKEYLVQTVNNDFILQTALDRIIQIVDETWNVKAGSIYENNAESQKKSGKVAGKPKQLTLDFLDSEHRSKPIVTPPFRKNLSPLQPTEVFDTYWRFAVERQNIFFRRLEGSPPPWTSDTILAHYKFTNAYRASDRVSQYLIRNVIYQGSQSAEEVFFRTLLFKIFNRIETWELLIQKLGSVTYSQYNFEQYDSIFTEAMDAGETIFSAAYIMPSGNKSFGYSKKHRTFLKLLEKMMQESVPQKISEMRLMRQAFELLRAYPLMGDFLAYQYVIDINYSELTNFSEMEFVVPGPGAKDGIRKCFQSLGGLNEMDVIRIMAEQQEEEFARLGLNFRSLWGRPLQLIDCQNLFCEVDKYARVAHPEIQGVSQRTRIKQTYQGTQKPVDYWYPPKWGINELLP